VVELPAAVVRHDDRVDPAVGGAARVCRRQDALQDDRPAPGVGEPAQVVPADRRVELGADELHHRRRLVGDVAHVGEGQRLRAEQSPPPARVTRAVGQGAQVERRRDGQPVAEVPLARAGHRRVDGQHQRPVAGLPGAGHQLLAQAAVAPDVQLEPQRRVAHSADVLERCRPQRGGDVRHAEPLRGRGDGSLAGRVHHAGEAGGPEHDREGARDAEHVGAQVDGADVAQHLRRELPVVERRAVAAQGDLVLAPPSR
jgi:hypothetical protein